jgi:hypothetical protein
MTDKYVLTGDPNNLWTFMIFLQALLRKEN